MMAGRPRGTTKLTPTTQTRIIEAIRSGTTQDTAARAAGIHTGTYHRWKHRGEQADQNWQKLTPQDRTNETIYRDFYIAVMRAWDEAHVTLAASIRIAGVPHEVTETKTLSRRAVGGETVVETTTTVRREHDWRAAAWILERRHPQEWAKTQQVEVSGPAGGPIPVELQARAADAIARARAKRERLAAEG